MQIESSGNQIYEATDYYENVVINFFSKIGPVLTFAVLFTFTISLFFSFYIHGLTIAQSLVLTLVVGLGIPALSLKLYFHVKYREYLLKHSIYFTKKSKPWFKEQEKLFLKLEVFCFDRAFCNKDHHYSVELDLKHQIRANHFKILTQC